MPEGRETSHLILSFTWQSDEGKERGGHAAGQRGTQERGCQPGFSRLLPPTSMSVTLFRHRCDPRHCNCESAEPGVGGLEQGANTALWCVLEALFTPSTYLQKKLIWRVKIGQKMLENTVFLPFHSCLCDFQVFYFPLKQCFCETPQIKKSVWGLHLASKHVMKDRLCVDSQKCQIDPSYHRNDAAPREN